MTQMASSNYMTVSATLLLLLLSISYVLAQNISPTTQTVLEKICDQVNCGKGTCKVNASVPYGFACECEAGWKRTREDYDDLTFLPCVIPNCTLNYNCQPAPPPVPAKTVPDNTSAFNPCYWIYCGEGKCERDPSSYRHSCQCNSGYSNLLNVSVYPCYSECTLGSDCSRLGIKVANSTTDNSNSQGSSFLPGKFHWVAVLMMSATMALWN